MEYLLFVNPSPVSTDFILREASCAPAASGTEPNFIPETIIAFFFCVCKSLESTTPRGAHFPDSDTRNWLTSINL
ncbi:MAG TPA: hypothetical protein VF700_01405 [Segetibacter sp.]